MAFEMKKIIPKDQKTFEVSLNEKEIRIILRSLYVSHEAPSNDSEIQFVNLEQVAIKLYAILNELPPEELISITTYRKREEEQKLRETSPEYIEMKRRDAIKDKVVIGEFLYNNQYHKVFKGGV